MAQQRPETTPTDTAASAARQRIEATKRFAPTTVRIQNPEDERRLKPVKLAEQSKTAPWATKTDPLLLRSANLSGKRAAKPVGRGQEARKDRIQDQGGFQALVKEIQVDGESLVEGFLRLQPGADPYAIPGFRVHNVSPDGRIASGSFSRSMLPSIASHPFVRKVEPSLLQRPHMQSSRQLIGADQVHLGTNLPQSYKGQGIVVGVFDTGIDAENPDFANEGGTRILNLLEYTADGGFKEWTKDQIDADPSSVTQRDGSRGKGHGTHVTGIAAGGGRLNSDFTGMAPESDIIFVKGDREDDVEGTYSLAGFYASDVIDGVDYIFRKADSLSKPVVVNLSLGGNSGPLDGTSAYEQFLTSLQGDGRIIVASAGNTAANYFHIGGDLDANNFYTSVDAPYDDDYYFRNIWYDAGSISKYKVVAIRVEDVDGQTVPYFAAMTDWLDVGTDNFDSDRGIQLVDTVAGESAGFIYHYSGNTVDEGNGDGEIYIEVWDGYWTGEETDYAWIDSYVWMIIFETSSVPGRMDSWGFYAIGAPYEFANVSIQDRGAAKNLLADQDYSITSPATAQGVISVGAFVSSNTFTVDGENTYYLNYPTDYTFSNFYQPFVGEIAYFSSRGPTRDGRQAPIVSAPGDRIFATRSQDIETEDLEGYTMDNGNYLSMQGTSMAAPHVSGLVALMLQADPTLDYADIVAVFDSTSTVDATTGTVPNMVYGHGRVDAYAAVAAVAGRTTSTNAFDGLPSRLELQQNYPNPFNPTTQIRFGLPAASGVTLEIYDVLGRRVAVLIDGRTLAAGWHEMAFDASGLSSGTYIYRITTPKASLFRSFSVIK